MQKEKEELEPSRAKKNWAKVRNIFLSKNLSHKQKNVKFQLFKRQKKVEKEVIITTYEYKDHVFIQSAPQPLYKELVEFKSDIDATGKWIWEAEQIAAYYLVHKAEHYIKQTKRDNEEKEKPFQVLELGAGCSGLAAIAFSRMYEKFYQQLPLKTVITDGQQENVPFLSKNIELNKTPQSRALTLRWGEQLYIQGIKKGDLVFNLILVCDCLYFTQFHQQLLKTLSSYLSEEGMALFVNPKRGDSMQQFMSMADSFNFSYSLVDFKQEKYESQIARLKESISFNQDKDLPYFIEMRKKRENS